MIKIVWLFVGRGNCHRKNTLSLTILIHPYRWVFFSSFAGNCMKRRPIRDLGLRGRARAYTHAFFVACLWRWNINERINSKNATSIQCTPPLFICSFTIRSYTSLYCTTFRLDFERSNGLKPMLCASNSVWRIGTSAFYPAPQSKNGLFFSMRSRWWNEFTLSPRIYCFCVHVCVCVVEIKVMSSMHSFWSWQIIFNWRISFKRLRNGCLFLYH